MKKIRLLSINVFIFWVLLEICFRCIPFLRDYWPQDGHLKYAGYRIMGEIISNKITGNKVSI